MTRYTPPRSSTTNTKASLGPVNGFGALRSVLELASNETGFALSDLTVLSAQVDPYRLDTPAGHRDGRWVAGQLRRALKSSAAKIHWRGLHYAIVSQGAVRKPNGEPYLNNDDNWTWLVNNAGKSARWLGYIRFEKIVDNRNAAPIIHRKARLTPGAFDGSNHSSGLPPKAFANTRIARLAPRRVAVRRRGGLRAVRRRASTATTRVTFMMRGLSRGGRYVVFRG